MAAAPWAPRNILGAGGFGVVVSPALNNVNAAGHPIQFPGYVSKIMISQGTFETAQQAAASLAAEVPSLALEFTPYTREYHVRNLPQANIQEKLQKIKEDQGLAYSVDDQVFVARMPNLGWSFRDISRTPHLRAAFQALPPEDLCRQILKCLRVVKNLKDADYVHADIRETNIMLNPFTGTITIIDFDWLRKKRPYYQEYPQYFYSHPPEEAIYHAAPMNWLDNPDRAAALADMAPRVRATFATMRDGLFWLSEAEKDVAADMLVDTTEDLYDFVHGAAAGTPIEAYTIVFPSISFPTIDLFGLGVSLMYLFRGPPPNAALAPLYTYIQTRVREGWCHSNFAQRLRVEAAIQEFEAMVRANYPGVALGDVPDFEDEVQRLGALADFYVEDAIPVAAPVPAAPAAAIAAMADAIAVIVHEDAAANAAEGAPVPPAPGTPPLPAPPSPAEVSPISPASAWSNLSNSPEVALAGAAAPVLNNSPPVSVGGGRRKQRQRKTRKGKKAFKKQSRRRR
jgi:hypothetical protein